MPAVVSMAAVVPGAGRDEERGGRVTETRPPADWTPGACKPIYNYQLGVLNEHR